MLGGKKMAPGVKDAMVHLASGVLKNTGVVTTQVDGKWYVSPLRTYSGVLVSLLQGLQPGDIDYFISLAKK